MNDVIIKCVKWMEQVFRSFESQLPSDRDSVLRAALYGLARLNLERIHSTAILIREKRVVDAGVLARCSLDTALNASYIWLSGPDKRETLARRFFEFESVERYTCFYNYNYLDPTPGLSTEIDRESEFTCQKAYCEAVRLFPDFLKNKANWAGKDIVAMLQELPDRDPANCENSAAKSAKEMLIYMYRFAFKYLSGFTHPSAQGLRTALVRKNNDSVIKAIAVTSATSASLALANYRDALNMPAADLTALQVPL